MPENKFIKYIAPLLLLSFVFIIHYCGDEAWAMKDAQKFYEEAEKLFEAGEFQNALEKYKELISIYPSFIGGYRGINKCYNSLEDPQAALMFMESLFLEYPEKGEVSYGLGYSLYSLGKFDDALTYFKKAIELNKEIAAAWNNCAVIYHYVLNDFRRARYYYEKAIEISKRTGDDWVLNTANENIANLPDSIGLKPVTKKMTSEDFINIFISYAETNKYKEIQELVLGQKKNSEEAMEWLIGKATRANVEGHIQDEKTLILLAEILQDEYTISFKTSDLNDLLKKYKSLSSIEKKEIAVGEKLLEDGSAMEKEGEYIEARSRYETALNCFESINDKNRQGVALLYIGDINRKLKDYLLAYDMYNKGLACFIETVEIEKKAYALLSLGEICFMLGKHSEAIDYLNRSLEIYDSLQDQEAIERIQSNLEKIKIK